MGWPGSAGWRLHGWLQAAWRLLVPDCIFLCGSSSRLVILFNQLFISHAPSNGLSRLQMRGNKCVYLASVIDALYLTVKYSMFSTLLTISAGW